MRNSLCSSGIEKLRMQLGLATSVERPMRRSISADGLSRFARRRNGTLRNLHRRFSVVWSRPFDDVKRLTATIGNTELKSTNLTPEWRKFALDWIGVCILCCSRPRAKSSAQLSNSCSHDQSNTTRPLSRCLGDDDSPNPETPVLTRLCTRAAHQTHFR